MDGRDRHLPLRRDQGWPWPTAPELRLWRVEDAEIQAAAVAESTEHLRTFMPWIKDEPMSIEARRNLIGGWREQAASGGDRLFGIWVGDRVAGGGGLHRRIGAGGLEIGYWVHVRFVHHGLATEASRALTDLAFEDPAIDRVEIHHDRNNVASQGVPVALGYELVGEITPGAEAPGESGVRLIWRVRREQWARTSAPA